MKRVYFIKPTGAAGPIKIGCSVEADKRLRSLQYFSPLPLELIATAEGGHDVERAIHHRFSYLSLHAEWFGVDAALLDFIDKVRGGASLDRLLADADDFGGTTNRRVASIKSQVTRWVSNAEKRVHSHRLNWGHGRPRHIQAILERCCGANGMPPTPEEHLSLLEYVAGLNAQPAFNGTWDDRRAAWDEYREHFASRRDLPPALDDAA